MRQAKPSAVLKEGFISKTFNEKKPGCITQSAWTHTYHKPYALDWGEAKKKAIDNAPSKHSKEDDVKKVKGEQDE